MSGAYPKKNLAITVFLVFFLISFDLLAEKLRIILYGDKKREYT